MVAFAILIAPVAAIVILIVGTIWLKRKAIGPRKEWGRWFAWYPVSVWLDDHGGRETRWLEWTERKSWDVISDVYHRPVGGIWERATW